MLEFFPFFKPGNKKDKSKAKPAQRRRLGFESLESREMLAVTSVDFDDIQIAYPDLGLKKFVDYNIIEVGGVDPINATDSFAFTQQGLQKAIDSAIQTAGINDLIVVRTGTTTATNTITLSSQLSISFKLDFCQKFGLYKHLKICENRLQSSFN